METTIRLFCSMSQKIAKCRQQPPLTYWIANPSSSLCFSRTFKKMLLKLPVMKDQFLVVNIPIHRSSHVFVNYNKNKLDK